MLATVTTNGKGVASFSCTFSVDGIYSVTGAFVTDGIFNDAVFSMNLVVKPKAS